MKRQRKKIVILSIFCLIVVFSIGWILTTPTIVPMMYGNKKNYPLRQSEINAKLKTDKTIKIVSKKNLAYFTSNSDIGNLLPALPLYEPLPYRIRHAVTYGAKAKITIRIVDNNSTPIENALIGGGFYNNGNSGHSFKQLTNKKGEITISDSCTGDLNFGVMKDGYYNTKITYWFYKHYYDCVKDGRWMPWNPTVEITIREKKNPVKLMKHYNRLRLPLPFSEKAGFDLLAGDLVEPYGKGKSADLSFTFDMQYNVMHYCYSNRLEITCNEGTQIAKMNKHQFSAFKYCYEPPINGWTSSIVLEKAASASKTLYETSLGKEEYWVVGIKRDEGDYFAVVRNFNYTKIGKNIEEFGVLMSYYINPTPNDRNLEIDGYYP